MATQSLSIFNSKYRNQFLASLTVQIITFTHGFATGWLSPTVLQLQTENAQTAFQITVHEISWIGSLFGLGSLIGNITFGVLIDRVGRKCSLYLMALPALCMWVLIYIAQNTVYLYVARLLGGITGGGNYVVVPIFISEIADAKIRGALSSMAMLMLTFGILSGYILATYLDYYVIPFIITSLLLIYLFVAIKFPETPQYLIKKQRIGEARQSYKYYHKIRDDNNATAAAIEMSDFETLKESMLKKSTDPDKLKLNDFINRGALKSFTTAVVLVCLNQLSGTFAIITYMSEVFYWTGTTIPPNICTIVMGVVQILGTCFSMSVVDRVGRKILFLCSAGGMALGYSSLAVYISYASIEIQLIYNWIPPAIMTFIIFVTSIAVVALVITVVVEILPVKIRSIGTSMCMSLMSSLVFITLKLFPEAVVHYGLAAVLYGFTGVCVASWIYILLFLKETKGKCLDY